MLFRSNVFALSYGTPAGAISEDDSSSFFGTKGQFVGLQLNNQPFTYPGSDIAASHPDGQWSGNQWILPHISTAHRDIPEQHVFTDIMQLIMWIREGIPAVAQAAHARHVIEIIEAGYRAASTGHTQVLTTTFAH